MGRKSKILLCLVLLVWPLLVSAQKGGKPPPQPERIIQPDPAGMTDFIPVMNILLKDDPRGLDCDPQMDSVWMDFSIDWTNCQMHRVDDAPIEIILPGTINGSNTLYWNLSSSLPEPGVLPQLYFVEDVLGRTGPAYGGDIPLTWEFSLDGGPFNPMTLQSDNTLVATFPPGPHTFQVRITGNPLPYQEDGYYHLQLSQCLVPEL